MKNGRVVGTAHVKDVTKDEVLGMIILGKCPPGAVPGPGAIQETTLMPQSATAAAQAQVLH
jgi:D-xylose transport system ATP-binding protein